MFDFFKRKKELKKDIDIKDEQINNYENTDTEESVNNINDISLIDKTAESVDTISGDTIKDDSLKIDELEALEDRVEVVENENSGFFSSLKKGLNKTRQGFSNALDNLLNGKATIDDDLYDELEEILISADIGVESTIKMIDELREIVAKKHIRNVVDVKYELSCVMKENLRKKNKDNLLNIHKGTPSVILVIGVNGVGKTTTIGKLSSQLKKEGKKVVLAAADTFRAAAIEQLEEWSKRANVELVRKGEGADPASVIFDAIHIARSKSADVLICDTAGRLHNKKNLMSELEKIDRIITREFPEANRENLLVLDSTTGQNAVVQAKEFKNVTDITGIILTKLDGSAKGGVIFPLQMQCNVPVKYIGIGEKIEDLRIFNSEDFVDAIL